MSRPFAAAAAQNTVNMCPMIAAAPVKGSPSPTGRSGPSHTGTKPLQASAASVGDRPALAHRARDVGCPDVEAADLAQIDPQAARQRPERDRSCQ
jgi:hypothetical protein